MSDDPAVPVAEPEAEPAQAPEKGEAKRRKKEAKLLAASSRPLDPWERYRGLVDTLEEAIDLLEISDRKARFALVIMGALNIAFFFVGTRPEMVALIPGWLRSWMGVYMLVYAGVALFFFLEAIEALRPRRFRPHVPYPGVAGPQHHPQGLRYYEDVVLRDLEAYRAAWRELRFGQLNAELMVQNHVMARINMDKHRSLRRLYGGLRVLTLLVGGLLAILALSMLHGVNTGQVGADAAPLSALAAGSPASLGPPALVAGAGIKEASGVAWHPTLRRLFAVGDGGTLADLGPDGQRAEMWRVKGNLEDVTFHRPSGRLVLLAEKKAELIVWDVATHAERHRFALDLEAVLGEAPASRNQGFEGIAFREDPAREEGGLFYLVHQRRPAILVTLAFDPSRPGGRIGAEAVRARHALSPHEDLTAVTWSEDLGRLLVVADAEDRLLVVSPAGAIEAELPIGGWQQEGVCLDDRGNLWVADDRAGLLRFDRAVPAIRAALGSVAHGGGAGNP